MATLDKKTTVNSNQSFTVFYNDDFAGQGKFRIVNHFIPDLVEVQIFSSGFANNFNGSDLYAHQLSCLPAGATLYNNSYNTLNPIYSFVNSSGATFNGEYIIESRHVYTGVLLESACMVIRMTFTKF